jgi:parallel beta-helix repeat protein
MSQPTLRILICCLPLFLLLAGPVHAVDGVLEINQAKVMGSGGFPFTITEPGSYRLTSDLTVGDDATNGINISAGDVTLDLNGFTIRGPSNGNSSGIRSGQGNIRIRNGTIIAFGSHGVWIDFGAIVEDVRVIGNGLGGVTLSGAGSQVVNCLVVSNGSTGITLGNAAKVTGTTSSFNSGHGIQVSAGSVVSGNTATNNSQDGISADQSTLSGNTVSANGGDGVYCSTCTVTGNTVSANAKYGLRFFDVHSGYANNVINGNTDGAVSSGTQIGTNLCNGTTTCP